MSGRARRGVVLRPGSPAEAGLAGAEVRRMVPDTEVFLSGPEPAMAGFVLLAARDGVVVEHAARGHALRWASWDAAAGRGVELPAAERVPMSPDTVFDIASLSKLFTALVVAVLAERGVLSLDEPAARHLPALAAAGPGKAGITVRQLLNHTAGMAPWTDLASCRDDGERMAAVLAPPLVFPPGTAHAYSDLHAICAGRVAEEAAGRGLAELVAGLVTGPLGLTGTGYCPPAASRPVIAATEYQPWTGRGMVRGEVHDENAWYMGGVAGHAGLFSTARDVAVLGQLMLGGGEAGGVRVAGEETVRAMLTPGPAHPGRGLGWELAQGWYMDALGSPAAFGHTGFTGTSLVADPVTGCLLVLLANRVHPTRERGTTSEYRRAPARRLAAAVAAGR
ncbi:hypothetical protein GCM10009716_38310 [Streptomyces sodiiphilus]|uniref:Beta-lactamase-related domain-containing protein n=1 Tax=Streptomyces sodiiphilus TaxID=226217 RepID=A0ABN2PP96_9ACTN